MLSADDSAMCSNPLAFLADKLDPPTFTPLPFGQWIDDKLGEFAWSKQRDVADSVAVNRRTAVHSAHEVGKSFIASRIASHWLDQHRPGEAFVVTTAPTFPQVRAILWKEINRAHTKGKLVGRVNQTEWWINNEIVAYGRKPSDYSPAAFQGIHAKYVLVVIDEAGGVESKQLWDAAGSLTGNEGSRILAIGNPDNPVSHFAAICAPGSGWNVIHISAFDSPNFSGEWVPDTVRGDLIGQTYVDEMRHEHGETGPVYISKVLGLFPEDNKDGVVPYSYAKACQTPREWTDAQLLPVELGIDLGAGGDETVIQERTGVKAGRKWAFRNPESMETVGQILEVIRETGATVVKVDVIGIGWGIAGRLQELRDEGKHDARIVKVNVGESSAEPDRFPKLRDQIWWEVGRELSKTGGWDLSEVDDQTITELVAPQFSLDSSGRTKVEKKSETKKRLNRSPDNADALLLAFYVSPNADPLVMPVGFSKGRSPWR